ncbi:glycosyl transferase family 2 [Philodulcilactobacillus myokoensis]|uniref:Glycosyl transferase family 2 n=1 Tax=Philodulcilactobacillus myokoensis TaxID=2929573 RepID=A0A9W6B2K5_9LACO|nr:glycosyltransferase family 2 protein [Philodulcilactobacillus myokoensis]GLB47606.1 glycosyl transferase family 2 [Philodulcilactobacillus myokoensis]
MINIIINVLLCVSAFFYIFYIIETLFFLANPFRVDPKTLKVNNDFKNNYDLWILIPALNEEQVIGATIDRLKRELNNFKTINKIHPHLLVVDDCSSDHTLHVALQHHAMVIQTSNQSKHQGKGSVLNTGVNYIDHHCNLASHNIIGIIDSDGWMRFEDFYHILKLYDIHYHHVSMVQSAVKMINVHNMVEAAQDFEFCGLNRKAQITRNNFGDGIASGNGQFVTLEMAKDVKWGNSLLEDMEFTMRGLLKGYHCFFTEKARVRQLATKTLKQYVHQRIRWCTGGFQCHKYLWRIYASKYVKTTQKFLLTIDIYVPFIYILVNLTNLLAFGVQIKLLIVHHMLSWPFVVLILIWLLLDILISYAYYMSINRYFHDNDRNRHLSMVLSLIYSFAFFTVNLVTSFIPIISLKNVITNNNKWDKTNHSK